MDLREVMTIAEKPVSTALERIFGFSSFRPGQEAIVRAIMQKRDVLAVMPTGGGKSLCYQLPACLMPGTCIVVSPLIALMKDQVDAACANGIRAACLNSSQFERERRNIRQSLIKRELDLLYVSPERLALEQFMDFLKQGALSLFAIDEAHCICSWGHDFRPDYLLLSEIVKQLPHVPLAAFTASATSAMQQEIVRMLGLRDPFRYCGSFNRGNLFYEVVPKTDADRQIISFVKKNRGESGIVYRTTRESVESTAEALRAEGISVLPYHAGLDDAVRRNNQEAFSRDRVEVVVATIAFGMGIDKSNVRYVVHGDLPRSLEHYYQETGRAGRDGDPAHCLLLFGRGDVPRLRWFIDQIEDEKIARQHRIALADMVAFASQCTCRRRTLLSHFGERLPGERCGGCDICDGIHESVDITKEAQMLLSAIIRTGERFGMNHLINIVWGADTRQIRSFGHDRLKTYGVGHEIPKRQWREMFDALLGQGICELTDGQYPTVKLTPAAREVLHGNATAAMVRKKVETEKRSLPEPSGADPDLFELLRRERRRLAEEWSVPPYIIFSDRTLHDMARRMPATGNEMLDVNGIGTVKLERFGARFLAVIAAFRASRPAARAWMRHRSGTEAAEDCR
ncbi:MAG: DNA helicase RecQ [Chitinispirillaceae bacterium]|nr:DNA helicase RecQ [Chitinispirillaceae bacterium]